MDDTHGQTHEDARRELAGSRSSARAATGPVRLFKSDFLEWFTRTKLATIPVLWLPLCAGLLFLGIRDGALSGAEIDGLVLIALLVWTGFEYTFHRFVFHLDRYFPGAESFCFLMHGSHHVDPGDAGRWLTPPVVSLPIFAGVLGIAALALGQDGGLVFGGVFGLAYVAYDVTHYACHDGRLRGRFGSYLRRYHLIHHFADDTCNYGVTSPLWDWILRTERMSGRRG